MPPSTTTRWCPTPEQLMILEELYRRGLRTPNSSQIQRITAHLAFYGKIQGKNVFYWFQNHKARDRQKLRKKLAKQLHQQHHHLLHRTLYQFPPDPPAHFAQPLDFFHLPPQGTGGVCEEGPEEVMMRQRWRADLPKDCSDRSDGHDSFMIMEASPTFPCCRSKPLQTLDLFPLTPLLKQNVDQQTPTRYSDDP